MDRLKDGSLTSVHRSLTKAPPVNAGNSLSDRMDVLMNDCQEAMLYCLGASGRNFYKPRYHLAKLHLAKGEPESALSQIEHLIRRSGRGSVWLHMTEITEDTREATVRAAFASCILS